MSACESNFKAYGSKTTPVDGGGESYSMFGCDGSCAEGLADPDNHNSGFLHTVEESMVVAAG